MSRGVLYGMSWDKKKRGLEWGTRPSATARVPVLKKKNPVLAAKFATRTGLVDGLFLIRLRGDAGRRRRGRGWQHIGRGLSWRAPGWGLRRWEVRRLLCSRWNRRREGGGRRSHCRSRDRR